MSSYAPVVSCPPGFGICYRVIKASLLRMWPLKVWFAHAVWKEYWQLTWNCGLSDMAVRKWEIYVYWTCSSLSYLVPQLFPNLVSTNDSATTNCNDSSYCPRLSNLQQNMKVTMTRNFTVTNIFTSRKSWFCCINTDKGGIPALNGEVYLWGRRITSEQSKVAD